MASHDDVGEVWMRVAFTPTLEDFVVRLQWLARKGPQVHDAIRRARRTGRSMGMYVAIAMVTVFVLSLSPAMKWLEPYVRYGTPMAMLVALSILGPTLIKYRGRATGGKLTERMLIEQLQSGAIEADLRPMTVEIGPQGIRVDRGTSTAWYAWEVVQRVEEESSRLLVFVTRDDAMVIPLLAFESAEHAARFRETIGSRMRRVGGDPSTPPCLPAMR